jgi:hypothetical protein
MASNFLSRILSVIRSGKRAPFNTMRKMSRKAPPPFSKIRWGKRRRWKSVRVVKIVIKK